MSRERQQDPANADYAPRTRQPGLGWLAVIGTLLSFGAVAQPRLDWVALVGGKIAPPLDLTAEAILAIRISGPTPGDLTLRLRSFPSGTTAQGPRDLPALALPRPSSAVTERVVPLPSLDRKRIAQFEAWLVDGEGRKVGRAAALTLDTPAAAALAPTAMQRLLDRGGDLLNELTRLYAVVRSESGIARHYTVALDATGAPVGKLVGHDAPPGVVSQPAVSPNGRFAAWTVVNGAGATVWLAAGADEAKPFWSGAAPTTGPVFVDDGTMVFANAAGVVVGTLDTTPSFRTVRSETGAVRAVHAAAKRDAAIRVVASVAEPGSDDALPFLLTLGPDEAAAKAVRLPASLYYKGYGASTDGGALFVAGTIGAVEGIYVAGPADAPLRNLFRCSSARMPAAASGGQRLHFIAASCTP